MRSHAVTQRAHSGYTAVTCGYIAVTQRLHAVHSGYLRPHCGYIAVMQPVTCGYIAVTCGYTAVTQRLRSGYIAAT